ncbi:hypothetical protein GUJ93_ZPchr0006g40811 [Zizania palustris]|uniref:Uncharacterized protein n=1 Tax=Zizania palustris TaxID=103762 RepID=A0A8J5SLI2_ZIZPA|nr:hypothetical protein GUJ93_ZPchr0006g40811 [Zizania palustris]
MQTMLPLSLFSCLSVMLCLSHPLLTFFFLMSCLVHHAYASLCITHSRLLSFCPLKLNNSGLRLRQEPRGWPVLVFGGAAGDRLDLGGGVLIQCQQRGSGDEGVDPETGEHMTINQ